MKNSMGRIWSKLKAAIDEQRTGKCDALLRDATEEVAA